MLFDVVELYRWGSRRPREEVRGSTPVRAELDLDRLWSWDNIERQRAPVHAHLSPCVLEPLYQARVVYMRKHHVLIYGQQRALAPGSRKREALYEQMWWCRLVRAGMPDLEASERQPAAPRPDQYAEHLPGQRSRAGAAR